MPNDSAEIQGYDANVTPAETPASAPANPPKEVAEDYAGFDIEGLISENDDFLETVPQEEVVQPTQVPAEQQVAQPETQPKQPEVIPPAQQQEIQQPVQPAQQPAVVEQAPAPTQDLSRQYSEFFERSADVLAKQVYALDDATKEKLDTSPSEIIPQLAGRLHMQILTAAVTQMANLFPVMMQSQMERQTIVQESENKFFTDFPELKAHKTEVERIARAYRSAHPNASFEQAKQEIGAMAKVMLRLPIGQTSQPGQGATMQPVVPTSARGGVSAMPVPGKPSEWDELIKDEE